MPQGSWDNDPIVQRDIIWLHTTDYDDMGEALQARVDQRSSHSKKMYLVTEVVNFLEGKRERQGGA